MPAAVRLFRNELKEVFTNKVYFLLIFAAPLLIALILHLTYKNEIVRNIPVAVFDEDNSELSRTITRYLNSGNYIDITKSVYSQDEALKTLYKEETYAVVHIPRGTETEIKSGKTVHLTVLKNTANIVIGNVILKDVNTVIRTVSAGIVIKKLRSAGLQDENAMNVVNPVKIETKSLFNPNYSYLYFLVPGLVMVTFQMSAMIIGVMIISVEFRKKTIAQYFSETGVSVSQFFTSKLSAHFIAHTVVFLLVYFVLFPLFNVNLKGNFFQQYILFIFFLLSAVSLGILISTLIHDQVFATEIALIVNTPAFMFSGLTFPLWGMPALHQWFAKIIPFTHYLEGFLKLNYMGLPLPEFAGILLKLSLFTFAGLFLSYVVMHLKRKKSYQD